MPELSKPIIGIQTNLMIIPMKISMMIIMIEMSTIVWISFNYYQLINNKFNHALLVQINSNLDHEIQELRYTSYYSVVTKSNQGCSKPGPADYAVKKPLPQSATISSNRQQRNLYKPFEPFPGPGTYESKSYIKVELIGFRMDQSVQ